MNSKNTLQIYNPSELLIKAWQDPLRKKVIHLISLFSTSGVYSSLKDWLFALESADAAEADWIVLHIISDGVDVHKTSLVEIWDLFTETYKYRLKKFEHKIILGSLGGRFYAMDNHKNWDRVALAMERMIDYKIVDPQDTGDNKVYKNYINNRFGVDLNKIDQGFSEKYNVHDWDKVMQEPRKNFFLFDSRVDLFMYTKDEIVERSRLGPLRTDIKWALELGTNRWYVKKRVYDDKLPPMNSCYVALNEVTKEDFDNARLINKNHALWFINSTKNEMQQMLELFCQINAELQLDLLILTTNNYNINCKKFLDINLDTFLDNNFQGYYPIFNHKSDSIIIDNESGSD